MKLRSALISNWTVRIVMMGLTGSSILGTGCNEPYTSGQNQAALTTDPDQVLAWNKTAMAVIGAAQNPNFQTRFMSLVQASVYDAVNSVTGDFEPYAVSRAAPDGATANAAAAGAAHYVLKHLAYAPPLTAALVARIDNAWAALPASISGNAGIGLGEQVAQDILALRASDGAPTAPLSPYTAPNSGDPGVWVAQPGALTLVPTWGGVTPWIMNSADQFAPDGPPALDSDTFVNDLAEVKAIGQDTSTIRTPLQTNIAKFWVPSAPVLWNPIARQVSAAQGLTVSQNARLFALLNLAAADAAITCFKAKYQYNFWRPITALQAAGEATWKPLIANPPFPEYVSGHTTISSAMANVLIETFGDDPGVPFALFSPSNPSFVHTWSTFSQGVDEVIEARIYSGIHYRNSDVVGARVGRQISHFDMRHGLRTNKGHNPSHGEHGTAPDESNDD